MVSWKEMWSEDHTQFHWTKWQTHLQVSTWTYLRPVVDSANCSLDAFDKSLHFSILHFPIYIMQTTFHGYCEGQVIKCVCDYTMSQMHLTENLGPNLSKNRACLHLIKLLCHPYPAKNLHKGFILITHFNQPLKSVGLKHLLLCFDGWGLQSIFKIQATGKISQTSFLQRRSQMITQVTHLVQVNKTKQTLKTGS